MLEDAGFEAYVVGGCVRDCLLQRKVCDWDICTSARPEETKQVFSQQRTIETGIKHGTLTVVIEGENLEITSFRSDGEYSDARHPESVEFGVTLEDDLSRRDFTCNAIAYSPKRGMFDFFGGREDIEKKLLRTVGNAEKRFSEDGLRILRALRFASTLGFEIEADTAREIHRCRNQLKPISGERLFSELKKLVCGKNAPAIVCEYHDVLGTFIPGFSRMAGFDQHSTHHTKDVLGHSADVLAAVPKDDPALCLAALFHDIGKPAAFFLSTDGRGRFFKHESRGASMLDPVWTRLKPDNATRKTVSNLVRYHHINLNTNQATLRRTIRRFGGDFLREEIKLMRADAAAHTKQTAAMRLKNIDEFEEALEAELAAAPCLSLDKLAVNGKDMINIGIHQGKLIGDTLSMLLDSVIEGRAENEREELLRLAEKYAKENKNGK